MDVPGVRWLNEVKTGMKTGMSRRALHPAVITAAVIACLSMPLAGPVVAKGENDLGTDRRSYTPGQIVRASIDTIGSRHLPGNRQFLRGVSGLPPDGQYVVSFRRSDGLKSGGGTEYVWVPADLTIIRREANKVGLLESRLAFEVPTIPSDQYVIRGCWIPCERRSLVGRAEISIGETEREALLLSRISTIQSRAVWMRSQSRQFRDRWNRTKDRLEGVRSELARAKPLIEDFQNRVWVLERRGEHERLAAAKVTDAHPDVVIFLTGAIAGLLVSALVRLLWRSGRASAGPSATHI